MDTGLTIFTEIQDKLDTKLFKPIGSFTSGCISKGILILILTFKKQNLYFLGVGYETDNGLIFIKINKDEDALEMFNGEMSSLNKINETKTIRVPKPYFVVADPQSNGGGLVMEYLNVKSNLNWTKLGSDLADLHLFNSVLGKKKKKLESWIGNPPVSELPVDIDINMKKDVSFNISNEVARNMEYVEQFGFEVTTCCGKIPQNNEWHDNWIEFYARNKLESQINLVIENYSDRMVIEYWSELQLKIDNFFTDIDVIEPSLLHGDLWNGNIGQVDDIPVIFDPASFYGHAEYELAISKLFGGFSQNFYKAYFKKIPRKKQFQRFATKKS